MKHSSIKKKTSRYVQGGITEVGSDGIEWWDRFTFPDSDSDILYSVVKENAGRLDKIAYGFYDNPELWWFIAQYNNILDPFNEIVPDRILYIPSIDRMRLLLTQKSNSKTSSRNAETILPPVVL